MWVGGCVCVWVWMGVFVCTDAHTQPYLSCSSTLITHHKPTNPPTHRTKGLEYYYAEEDEEERARAEARLAPMTGAEGGVDASKAVRAGGVVMRKVS